MQSLSQCKRTIHFLQKNRQYSNKQYSLSHLKHLIQHWPTIWTYIIAFYPTKEFSRSTGAATHTDEKRYKNPEPKVSFIYAKKMYLYVNS